MKKVLLATTALIAASAFAAPAKADLEVTVGGFTAFQAGFFDNDSTTSSDRDFQSEAQIAVMADGTADNGLQYGAKVLLDASTSDTTNSDEVGIYLAGSWGRVELGDDDGASELVVYAPTVGVGQINGSYDDFISSTAQAHFVNDRGDHNFTALDSDDSTKITYYTPKFSGFQAGVSYAPEYQYGVASVAGVATLVTNTGGEAVTLSENGSLASDIFEFGLGYEGEVSGVGVKVGGNYIVGTAIDDFDPVTAGTQAVEDLNAWSLGAQVAYNGFKFGGGYTSNGDSFQSDGVGSDDVTSWNIGATYENGPWGVGVSYLDTDFDTNAVALTAASAFGLGGVGGDYTAWAMGATYKVAPGLTTGADLAFYDRNATGTANDEDGFVALVDVTAAF
jgi:outer membrane protein OmpU